MAVKFVENKNTDTLVVVFSSFQSSLKKTQENFSFTFYNLFSASTSYSYLFIGDESNSWYTNEIKGVNSNNIDDLFSFIQSKADFFKKVVLFGSSMGAYAALYGAKYSWVTRVIVLSPQVFIKEGWPRHPLNRSLNVPDLTLDSANFSKLYSKKITYFVGEYCLFDQFQAWALLGINSANQVIIVRRSYHNVCFALQKMGFFLDLIFYAIGNSKFTPSSAVFSKISVPLELQSSIFSDAFMFNVKQYYEYKFVDSDCKKAYLESQRILMSFPQCKSLNVEIGLNAWLNKDYDSSFKHLLITPSFVDDRFGPLLISYLLRQDRESFIKTLQMSVSMLALGTVNSTINSWLKNHILDDSCKVFLQSCLDEYPNGVKALPVLSKFL